jgi:hypothetical protein
MSLAKTIAWATLATGASAFTFTWQRREAVQLRAEIAQVQPAGAGGSAAEQGGAATGPGSSGRTAGGNSTAASGTLSNAPGIPYYRELIRLYRLDISRVPHEIFGILNYDVMARWARDDVPGALAQARRISNPVLRAEALAAVAGQWAAHNPAAATAWVNGLPSGPERDRVLMSLIEDVSGKNPTAALALVPEISAESTPYPSPIKGSSFQYAPSKENAARAIFCRWALQDPLAALNASASVDSNWRQAAIAGIDDAANAGSAEILPVLVPHALSLYLAEPEQANFWGRLVQYLFHSASLAYPERVVAWLDAMPDGTAKAGFRKSIVSNWADQVDPAAALAYAETLPDGSERDSLVAAVLGEMVRWDPDGAARDIYSLPAGSTRDSLIKTLIGQRLPGDPAGALALWQSLSSDAARTDFAPQAFASPVLSVRPDGVDPLAAEAWLQILPHGDARDRAVARFTAIQAEAYPDLLVPWLAQIDDDKTRQNTTAILAATWLKSDPAAATAWLAQTDLPDQQKHNLLIKAGL